MRPQGEALRISLIDGRDAHPAPRRPGVEGVDSPQVRRGVLDPHRRPKRQSGQVRALIAQGLEGDTRAPHGAQRRAPEQAGDDASG